MIEFDHEVDIDYKEVFQKHLSKFHSKFLPNMKLDEIFTIFWENPKNMKTRKSFSISNRWFKDPAKPETHTKRAIEGLLLDLRVPRDKIIEEKTLSKEKSLFSGKVDTYPDFMVPKGEGINKGLIIEVEHIGKNLTQRDHGISQVQKWFEIAGVSDDFNGLATNFTDWVFFKRKEEGYGMDEFIITPIKALKIIANTYHGSKLIDETKGLETQTKTIEKFYKTFNDRLQRIKAGITGVSKKYANYKILNIPSHLPIEEQTNIGITYFRTNFFRILFIKILKEWNLIREDPIKEIIKKDSFVYQALFQQLFFDIFNKDLDERSKNPDLLNKFQKLPYLNGGLFRFSELETKYPELKLSSMVYEDVYKILEQYSFVQTEEDKTFINPEVLGYLFENTLDVTGDRSKTGSYYTPEIITKYMAQKSIELRVKDLLNKTLIKNNILTYKLDSLEEIEIIEKDTRREIYLKMVSILKSLTICDNACGSGAFLKACGNTLVSLYKKVYLYFKWNLPYQSNKKVQKFKRPFKDLYEMKKHILQNNLFGVDNLYSAIEICELRLWLWMIEPPIRKNYYPFVEPLPNIDFNIQCGNSLIGYYDSTRLVSRLDIWMQPKINEYQEMIKDYYENPISSTTISNKSENLRKLKGELNDFLNKELKTELEELIKRKKKTHKIYQHDNKVDNELIARLKPFHWIKEYSNIIRNGGFDILIGNPPYIKEAKNSMAFEGVHDSPYYQGKMDIWYMFMSTGIDLLKKNGILSYIAQNNWNTSSGASKLRNKVITQTELIEFTDFNIYYVFKNVGIQTMICFLRKKKPKQSYLVNFKKLLKAKISNQELYSFLYSNNSESDYFEQFYSQIEKEKVLGNIITFLDATTQEFFNKLESTPNIVHLSQNEIFSGIDLNQYHVKKAHLKILGDKFSVGTGIFFLTNEEKEAINFNSVELDEIVKPFYTSSEFERFFGTKKNQSWILYTKPEVNDLIEKYPNVKKHLDQFLPVITSDNKPYGIHRTRDPSLFIGEKIFSLRKCKHPRFTYVDFDAYVGRAFNIIKTDRINLKYLTALLNSDVIAFWLKYQKTQGPNYQVDQKPLMSIPIVLCSHEIQERLINMVNQILRLSNENEVSLIFEEINKIIFTLYSITNDEQELIKKILYFGL